MRRFHFLVSSERSGSNFLTSLLDGHSAVCGPPPTHLFRLFGTNEGNYGDLDRDESWQCLVEDVVLNLSCMLGQWHTTVTAAELRREVRTRSAAELLRFVYEKEAANDGAERLFVKENRTYTFAPYLLEHFPDCSFVFLVRDPRDVASSWVRTEGIPGGVDEATRIWVEDQTASLALYDRLYDTGRIELVRYEDLVQAPEKCLEDLTRFLGLPYEADMLNAHRQRRTIANAERIGAWSNLGKPVLRDNCGSYRSVLSETDVRFVELATWRLVAALGYEPEVITRPPEGDVAAELDRLRPALSPGSYSIGTESERQIRRKRLAAIDRVLSRRL